MSESNFNASSIAGCEIKIKAHDYAFKISDALHPENDIEIERCDLGYDLSCPIIALMYVYNDDKTPNFHRGENIFYTSERLEKAGRANLVKLFGATCATCKQIGKEKFLQIICKQSSAELRAEFDRAYLEHKK